MTQGRPGVADRYRRVMEPATLAVLRRVFNRMNRGMVLLWRLGLGRFAAIWPRGLGKILVIEHTGRRTGTRYRTPVNYAAAGDEVYCVAAFGERTDWYRNLVDRPRAALWLPQGRWEVEAEDASDSPERLVLMRSVLLDSGFAAHLFGLHPNRLDDAELARATESYRLMRFSMVRRQPSPDGPDDLLWVWPPLVAAASMWLCRRASRSGCRRCR